MKINLRILSVVLTAFIIAGIYLFNDISPVEKEGDSGFSVGSLMSDNSAGYKEASEQIKFVFPKDHAAHPEFKTEWWYFTGNIINEKGENFGYQLTIFRNATSPVKPEISSNFLTNQIYSGHFAISDIKQEKFYHSEIIEREFYPFAYSDTAGFLVTAGGWKIEFNSDTNGELPEILISASDSIKSINFTLVPDKKPVFHGDNGLSPKSYKPGNASYYYSFTRLKTLGTMTINGDTHQISGNSWMDREWSSGALDKDQKGWDWFSIQLVDSTEIMFFRLRDFSGNTNFAKGTFIFKDGATRLLKNEDVTLHATSNWKNSDGIFYPSSWTLRVPSIDLELNINTSIPNQELKTFVNYYEGAIIITGIKSGVSISGKGYVELTGYD
ncbi:MAG: carotenoid 1,2-hydratase [Ignavibacteriaceae bacterium]|nr:carotenoid 1,2-hydratase [Ignavibacteriaceae bacterium]